jgi:hypothetical protein
MYPELTALLKSRVISCVTIDAMCQWQTLCINQLGDNITSGAINPAKVYIKIESKVIDEVKGVIIKCKLKSCSFV